jgi:hypothetical protein
MLLTGAASGAALLADHNSCSEFDQIPSDVIVDIAAGYRIYYGHTSHGSQIMSGMDYLEAEDAKYAQPVVHEVGADLGHNGDTSWVPNLRSWLGGNPDYNMAMMSWCGGASDNTDTGIDLYLAKMNELEADFPGVHFVYMTGHLDGGGPSGSLYRSNNRIRTYCAANDKILYDFADIESWDPNGVYYPNESDACGWCSDWCIAEPCCIMACSHSQCFNCYQKGKAWWTMMAEIEGWNLVLDVDEDHPGVLPQTLRLDQNYPNPFNPVTTIEFDLASRSQVRLEVIDLLGRVVAVLVDGELSSGTHRRQWDSDGASSGVYFYRLDLGETVQSRKMLLLR